LLVPCLFKGRSLFSGYGYREFLIFQEANFSDFISGKVVLINNLKMYYM